MLKSPLLCLAAILLLPAPLAFAGAAPAVLEADPAIAARIDAVVAPHYKAGDPGATLLVIKDGKTLLRKADGMADLNKGVPMQPGMALRLGSVTKQFTSTAILMLADEGKLERSDPVTKYFPDYSSHGKSITMEHLLTHTSGITNYTSKVAFALLPNRDRSVTQI